jgi:hypothetical protein
MKKKNILIGLVILMVGMLVLLIVYVGGNNNTVDQPGTTTLTTGTQMRYGDISIGLSNIENDSASLSIHDNVTDVSAQKQVKAGDTIDVYGYQIMINSVKALANPSILPGASHGYVKFVVNKK